MKSLKLESPVFQYFIGFFINLVIIFILFSSNVTYNNLQLPENKFKDNIWKNSDVVGYVEYANNYLKYGVVGEGETPSTSRSIGYPLYLSMFMKLFKGNWLLIVYLFQAVVFAFLYPIFTKIIQLIFAENKRLVIWSFLFLLISGMYFSYTTIILTDTIFTLFLTAGICFGLIAIKRQSWCYLTIHVVMIGIAGQIRPILFLYFIPDFFILIAIANKYKLVKNKKIKLLILASSLLVLITCNLPTVRNYLNYNVISPSTNFQYNLFNSHATKILMKEGREVTIDTLYSHIDTSKNASVDLSAKIRMKYAIKTFLEYPLPAVELLVLNVAGTLMKNHYVILSNFWDESSKGRVDISQMIEKKRYSMFVVTVIFGLIYFLLYLLFLSFCIRLMKGKKFLYLFTILLFVAYFLIPAGFVGPSVRFRLPVEGFMIIFSLYELLQFLSNKSWSNRLKK